MKHIILLSLLLVASCANNNNEVEEVIIKKASKFVVGDCIFGGGGTKEQNHTFDQGYKVIGVNIDKNQYLLKCLTETDCKGGLKTWWINQFDEWLLKVDCSEIEVDNAKETS